MAKNLIPEIAKMLGVELGEEFKIEGDNRTYWFDLDGLPNEYALLDKGWVYRSQAEAEAALPAVAAEMGVRYEL